MTSISSFAKLPKIARGNPFIASCAITDLTDGTPAANLTVTAYIGARKGSTEPIDPALSVDAVMSASDPSTTSRAYDASFDGDNITALLEQFDYTSVWLIFECPSHEFRVELEYGVIPGQCG